jgi:hypothetical protein
VLNQLCSVFREKVFDIRNLFDQHIFWLFIDFFIFFYFAQNFDDLAFFSSLQKQLRYRIFLNKIKFLVNFESRKFFCAVPCKELVAMTFIVLKFVNVFAGHLLFEWCEMKLWTGKFCVFTLANITCEKLKLVVRPGRFVPEQTIKLMIHLTFLQNRHNTFEIQKIQYAVFQALDLISEPRSIDETQR